MKSLYNIFLVLLVLAGVCGLSSTSVAQQNNEQKIIFGNQDKTITVYPVPASTVAYIRLSPSLKNEVDKVELVNLIGRKIADQPVIDKNAEIVFNNLNEQPAGIYMIIARDKFGKILQSTKLVLGK